MNNDPLRARSTTFRASLRTLAAACAARGACVALVLAALSGHAAAGGFVVPFSFDVNHGGWAWPGSNFQSDTDGNPDWNLNGFVCCVGTQVRSLDLGTPFTGDLRAQRVDALGIDLKTLAPQPTAPPLLSLVLSGGGCQVYVIGSQHVPTTAEGWKSFTFDVPSQSTVLPSGWQVLGGCADPDAAWNAVITGVSQVAFFYGNPSAYFIHEWKVRADNPRISSTLWSDLGNGLPGTHGQALLSCWGELTPGSTLRLWLQNAPPASSTALVVGQAAANLPFKGGVMVPQPDLLLPGFVTDATGQVVFESSWPPGLPSGLTFHLQHWITDAAGPKGLAASNAMRGTTP